MTVSYLSRTDWGAGALRAGHTVPTAQFVGLVSHHTVMAVGDYDRDGIVAGDVDDAARYMRHLQSARPDLGNEVPYSYVVLPGASPMDSIVAEGRGPARTGAHTPGYNSTRWGVAWAGDYTQVPPTPGMMGGFRWVGARLARPADARPAIGHRDVYATQCPGNAAYPLLAALQPPYTGDPPPNEDAPEMSIVEFLDWPGQLWLVRPGPTGQGSWGTRQYIPDWAIAQSLIAVGARAATSRVAGGTFYAEVT